MRLSPSDRRLMVALLSLNMLLKFSWLGVNELGGDEPFTVFWSQRSLGELFEMLRSENNPPLYFLLVKGWSLCVPLDETWLRMPSALFSAATIWPLFLVARALGDRAVALVTCLLFTFSGHQFMFAHEVRAYSLLVLLAVLSMWTVVRASRSAEPPRWKKGPLLALVLTVMVYTHFFGWLVIALLGASIAAVRELRPVARSFMLATALTLVAYAPYALIFFHRAGESMVHGTWVKPHGVEEIWHMVRRWSNQPVVTILLLVPILVTMLRDGVKPVLVRLSVIWWLVPLFGLWLMQWLVPVYVDRYLLFASPGFYLLAGHGLVRAITTDRLRWLLPIAGAAAMALTFTPWKGNGRHPSAVAAQVRSWQRSLTDPPVLINPFYYKLTFQWAMDRRNFAHPSWRDPWSTSWNNEGTSSIDDPSLQEVLVVSALAPEDPTWRTTEGQLRERFPNVEVTEPDVGVRVMRFHR